VIYDNPGLGSKLAFEAVKQFGWGFGAVKILKPDFIVLRRWELRDLSRDMADVVAQYEEVAHRAARENAILFPPSVDRAA